MHRYVPILRGKRGEFNALKELDRVVAESITPLLELQPVTDGDAGAAVTVKKTKSLAKTIEDAWGIEDPLFIDDQRLIDSIEGTAAHPLELLFEHLREGYIQAVPVYGFDRTEAYKRAVTSIAALDDRGIVLRIDAQDLSDPKKFQDAVEVLSATTSLPLAKMDLIWDLRAVGENEAGIRTLTLRTIIPMIYRLTDWRSFTIAATSFPEVVSKEVSKNSIERLPRLEWTMWQALLDSDLPRLPSYGDYGADNPNTSVDIDPRFMSRIMTAGIRYSSDDSWLIIRGDRIWTSGYEQYHALCQQLIAQPEYKGADFSNADGFISRCSTGEEGTGNQTTWRGVATNHHLTLVAQQLANLP